MLWRRGLDEMPRERKGSDRQQQRWNADAQPVEAGITESSR